MKTRDLDYLGLCWAVAKALGYTEIRVFKAHRPTDRGWVEVRYNPEPRASTARFDIDDWHVTGRLIDQLDISVGRNRASSNVTTGYDFVASLDKLKLRPDRVAHWYSPAVGPTRQVAVARCFAQAMLGEDIELPEGIA